MSKMQIPLNGSNYISKNRQQAFQDALANDHQVNYDDDPQVKVSQAETVVENVNPQVMPGLPAQQDQPLAEAHQLPPTSRDLDIALDHTYNHQQRTMEIHQQYLAQQAEYIQLITAVLDQQGKALNFQDGATASGMIETFQRTLDNFHAIREQGVDVHRVFLNQQAAFSERYLAVLENGQNTQPIQPQIRPAPIQSSQQVTEWVVQQPPIVLGEHAIQTEDSPDPIETPPAEKEPAPGQEAGVLLEELTTGLLEIVSEKTGYPVEMLELDMDLEADLGIDSIKRVEILGSLEERYPALPASDTEVLSQTRTLQEIIQYMDSTAGSTAPSTPVQSDISPADEPILSRGDGGDHPPASAPAQTPAFQDLTQILMEVVAEKTGYPPDMLELDMDMEADLGIDSIKRVEILGAMEEHAPGLPSIEAETLAELRTLGQIVTLLGRESDPPDSDGFTPAEEKKKVNSLGVENTPAELISLPRPDHLEFTISHHRPLILTSDGTELANHLREFLDGQGWKTILWKFPDFPGSVVPGDAPSVTQTARGADAIHEALEDVRSSYGIPGGFIHLHPSQGKNGLFSEQEERIIREVFLIAGALHDDLNQAESGSRNLFLSITRTDGTLGFHNREEFQEGSGLTGLVKSLSWEWPEVFCRSIDFNREMSPAQINQFLLDEIHDPARTTTEVGLDSSRRVTIRRDYRSK